MIPAYIIVLLGLKFFTQILNYATESNYSQFIFGALNLELSMILAMLKF